jgi:ketosteroid isomerase-like protein
MAGSASERLSPKHFRFPKGGWAIAAAVTLAAGSILLYAGIASGVTLAQKHENRHEIDQFEDAWRNAVLASDTKAMDNLLAEDYVGITANGTIEDKDQTLARLRAGGRHVTSLTISERKVRFYEKTAVVTSLVDVQAANNEGSDVSGSYRYTRVYIRNEQGKWKIVSFEASRIREPGPRHKSNF